VKETLEIEKKEKEMNVCKAKFAERKRKYAVVFNKAINGANADSDEEGESEAGGDYDV